MHRNAHRRRLFLLTGEHITISCSSDAWRYEENRATLACLCAQIEGEWKIKFYPFHFDLSSHHQLTRQLAYRPIQDHAQEQSGKLVSLSLSLTFTLDLSADELFSIVHLSVNKCCQRCLERRERVASSPHWSLLASDTYWGDEKREREGDKEHARFVRNLLVEQTNVNRTCRRRISSWSCETMAMIEKTNPKCFVSLSLPHVIRTIELRKREEGIEFEESVLFFVFEHAIRSLSLSLYPSLSRSVSYIYIH